MPRSRPPWLAPCLQLELPPLRDSGRCHVPKAAFLGFLRGLGVLAPGTHRAGQTPSSTVITWP